MPARDEFQTRCMAAKGWRKTQDLDSEATGNTNRKVLPLPISLSNSTRPRCARIICRTNPDFSQPERSAGKLTIFRGLEGGR